MFVEPSFEFWNVFFTAVGASVLWTRWGKTKLKAFILSDLLDLLPLNRTWRNAIEFLVFIVLGVIVGIGATAPVNPQQAIAAGLGWTGLFAQPRK